MGDSIIHGVPMVLLLVSLGFFAGGYGTLVGLGGAVVLIPVLLLSYPDSEPQILTSITMGVVFINALTGTSAYARQKRIDYCNGVYFAIASIPGTIVGVWVLSYIHQQMFSIIFGAVLLIFSVVIWLRPKSEQVVVPSDETNCALTVRSGVHFDYACNRPLGIILSFVVGFIAGLLGIGGGIIHMPILLYVLHFPVHIATATSHFILAFTGLAGALTHAIAGTYVQSWNILLWIVLGVIPGAYVGAWLSPKIKGLMLVRLLALALVLVGVRLVVLGIWG